jgi:SAM-dependent methyltransferase
LKSKTYRGLAYGKYISSHFSKLHNIDEIDEEYEKTYWYWKDYIHYYLPKDSNTAFLDLGCGLGHAMNALKRFGYKNVKGLDVSSECVEFCKRRGFDVEEADILKFLEVTNVNFQVIYAFDVLEHFDKDEALQLINLARLRLSKEGLLLLLLPNANNLSNLRLRYMDITHEVFYTPESITQLLHCGGFENIRIVGLKHFSLSDKSRLRVLFKSLLALPIYKISELFQKIFYLSMGIFDTEIVAPRILVIAKVK